MDQERACLERKGSAVPREIDWTHKVGHGHGSRSASQWGSFHGRAPNACGLGDVLGIGRGLNRLHVCLFRPAWLAVGKSSQRDPDTAGSFPERRTQLQGGVAAFS